MNTVRRWRIDDNKDLSEQARVQGVAPRRVGYVHGGIGVNELQTEVTRPVHNGHVEAKAKILPNTVERRFGVEIVDVDPDAGDTVLTMNLDAFRNQENGLRSLGPLALLLDGSGGMANHLVRPPDMWTITSELSIDLDRAAMTADGDVVASARSIGSDSKQALSLTTFRMGGVEVGTGLIRSFYVPAQGVEPVRPQDPMCVVENTTLLDRMSVRSETDTKGYALIPMPDPILNNDMGMVHGGVVAATLELVAQGSLRLAQDDSDGKYTGSMRINYLRPMRVGGSARYTASPVRVGRGTAVMDGVAIGDDGRPSAIARVTAYR